MATKISELADGSKKAAEDILVKAYYTSIAKADSDKTKVVMVLPPSGDDLWTWNRSFDIACAVAAQYAKGEVPLLVPEIAEIFIEQEEVDTESDDSDMLDGLIVFSPDGTGHALGKNTGSGNKSTDDDYKPRWLEDLDDILGSGEESSEDADGNKSQSGSNSTEAANEQETLEIAGIIARANEESFAGWLSERMEESGWKAYDLAQSTNMTVSTIAKLRDGEIPVPAKGQALAIGMSLQLDADEMEHMLGLAGYTLSPNVPRDMIVLYYMKRGIYDIVRINRTLFVNEIPTIGTH